MTTQAQDSIEAHFQEIEQRMLLGNISSHYWSNIEFRWMPLTLKRGGTKKRKGSYGDIQYSIEVANRQYKVVTREEALAEARKPHDLRRALIEANTMLECSMCGLVVVGDDAIDPYTSIAYDYKRGAMVHRRQWGLVFMRMNENDEPIMLNLCPNCMQRIANGEFREGTI